MDDKTLAFYQNAEISREKHIEPTVIKNLKANVAQEQQLKQGNFENMGELFDDDVIDILANLPKNTKDRQIINGLIRAVYA
ncbi:MAG: hypothetical protein Q4D68_01460 [Moraxella equi]|nr:hypothetical protein [Moraxella equi]